MQDERIDNLLDLRHALFGKFGARPFRIEDQNGRLLGNVVTDIYSHEFVPGESVYVIAVDIVEKPAAVEA